VGGTFSSLVTDGPLLVAAAVAALVGLISFASPCVLPLVPGYLAYVSGLVGTGDAARDEPSGGGTATAVRTGISPRTRMVLGAVLFVLGFTAVFVTINLAVGALGRFLLQYNDVITRVMGVVTIVVGLAFLGWLPLLQRTKRLTARPAAGLAGAPLLGIVFGLGWTPCLGPTLAAVTSLAFQEGTAARGAFLGLAYCLGLGIPFVLVALGARWAVGATSLLRRNARTVTRVGGAFLVLVGLLLVTGMWTELMFWLRSWAASTGIGSSL
jgi:cytochrome c-type biogenesis protein